MVHQNIFLVVFGLNGQVQPDFDQFWTGRQKWHAKIPFEQILPNFAQFCPILPSFGQEGKNGPSHYLVSSVQTE